MFFNSISKTIMEVLSCCQIRIENILFFSGINWVRKKLQCWSCI